VQEYSTPLAVDIDETAALSDAVRNHAEKTPDAVAFRRKEAGGWASITAKDFADEVSAVAKGLIASGVQAGDRVGLMSKTRYEWTLCDYAIWAAGAVTVPVYETSSAEQVQWNLGDSGAVAVILESESHQNTFASVRDQLPDLKRSWSLDAGELQALKDAGRDVPDSELDARRATLDANSLATIIYTSGTTGRPKGCELTHGQLLYTGRSASAVLPELFNSDGSTLLFLPLAHVFARLIQVASVETGSTMGHTADIKNLLADFATFKPTFILSVPRVFEKVYNTAKQKAHADGKGAIFDRAEKVAIAYSEGLERGSVGLATKLQHGLFDKVVYSKLRAAMGGRVAWAVSGGAPLGARLGHFFRGIGVTILEGWGLTETTAAGTVNTPANIKIGTVGRPSPGVTVRVADDGELLMTGSHIMTGYWHNPTATAEILGDGWFHTGDIGEIDGDGFVKITGRKKELIVTAGGKNVAPAVLEDRLRAHPLVSQCMVVGDQQPYIACLVTLDAEAMVPWAKAHGKDTDIATLAQDPDLIAEIQRGVDEANKAVSKAEAIRKFTVLPVDWTEEGGQLTPSLKLKRSVVMKECAADVDALYVGRERD
jgi:long-chain acyl-CoA synthetase